MENDSHEQLYGAFKDMVMADNFNAYDLSDGGKNPIFDEFDECIPSELCGGQALK